MRDDPKHKPLAVSLAKGQGTPLSWHQYDDGSMVVVLVEGPKLTFDPAQVAAASRHKAEKSALLALVASPEGPVTGLALSRPEPRPELVAEPASEPPLAEIPAPRRAHKKAPTNP